VVSELWCCRAGAVESASAVVAGEVVYKIGGERIVVYIILILWDTVRDTAHTTGHARGYHGGNFIHQHIHTMMMMVKSR